MKKSLVALAALVTTGAFAQSSVTISGYFDRGYTDLKSSDATASTKTLGSSAGTTSLFFKGNQDLGGGLNAMFSVETDWADFGGATQTATIQQAQKAGFANGENFIGLGTSAGTFKFGAPNSFMLGAVTGVGSPALSTGVGSAYSTKFMIFNGVSTGADGYAGTAQASSTTAGAVNSGARAIRIANTIQYTSPSMNGFVAGFGYTPQNNNVTANGGNGNTVGVTEYNLRYTNGPLDAVYSSTKYSVGSNAVNQYTLTLVNAGTTPSTTASDSIIVSDKPILGTAKSLTAGLNNTQSFLGATYAVLPSVKLHAGFGNTTSSNSAYQTRSTQFGATYTVGAWDVMGQVVKVDDQATSNNDRKLTGLGVNYNLSKTTRLYGRWEDANYLTNKAAASGSSVKRTALGMSMSF